jgi:8-oxo-dGTP diphosphatase
MTPRPIAPSLSTCEQAVAVAAGVVFVDGRILIGQRRAAGRHPLKWEFPGGKIEPGEDPAGALVRELREELGVDAMAGSVLHRSAHRYRDGHDVDLFFLQVDAIDRPPANLIFADLRWVAIAGLAAFDFLPADLSFVAALRTGAVLPRPTRCGGSRP